MTPARNWLPLCFEMPTQPGADLGSQLGMGPDFKTIADFRKDNGEAVRGVCW